MTTKEFSMTSYLEKISLPLSIVAMILVVALGVTACNKQSAPPDPPPPTATEATLAVEGMTCASCTVTVRTAAKGVEGVYDARANVQKQSAWVSYDAKRTDPAAIAAAITHAGYKATLAER